MLRKILAVFCVLLCVFSLCGCSLFTADTDELLSPPSLSGDMKPIAQAISESEKANYTFRYPSRGDYRSAVVQHDINKDGILEAFAFYSTQENENVLMHINVVEMRNGEWKSITSQSITAGGVDRVDFCDIDNDGSDEVFVGWEIYGNSELQMAVYNFGENALTQLMLEKYTHYVTCDLNGDEDTEILVIKANPTESINTAHVFSITPKGVSQISSCELDSTVKTFNHPVISTLSTGKTAVYIDEIKGVGAVTEVLYMEKEKLLNPLLDTHAKENFQTLRSANLETYDINGDGVLEIPVQQEVPTVSKVSGETIYLTNWCSFNGEALTIQLSSLINTTDGYYYSIPKKWSGKIAVLKDSENKLMEIYKYNPKKKTTGERLVYFKAVKKDDWDKGVYSKQDVFEIVNNGKTSYICHLSSSAEKDGIDSTKIKNDFKIY